MDREPQNVISVFEKFFGTPAREIPGNPGFSLYNYEELRLYSIVNMKGYKEYAWDKKQAANNIKSIEYHLLKLRKAFCSLPKPLQKTINDVYVENGGHIGPGCIIKGDNSILKDIDGMNFNYTIEATIGRIYGEYITYPELGSKLKKDEKDSDVWIGVNAISKSHRENKPLKDISEEKSGGKWTKILIIDRARRTWGMFKGEEAPKSIPDQGSEFGDFLKELFEALNIDVNVRAVLDAWRKDLGKRPGSITPWHFG